MRRYKSVSQRYSDALTRVSWQDFERLLEQKGSETLFPRANTKPLFAVYDLLLVRGHS
jgi:hypothetical protein